MAVATMTDTDLRKLRVDLIGKKLEEERAALDAELRSEMANSQEYQQSRQQSLDAALLEYLDDIDALVADCDSWREKITNAANELMRLASVQQQLSGKLTSIEQQIAHVAGAHFDAFGSDGQNAVVNAVMSKIFRLQESDFLRAGMDTRLAAVVGLSGMPDGRWAASRVGQSCANALRQAKSKAEEENQDI